MQKLYVGIDIGGTNTKYGIIDSSGNILFSAKKKTYRQNFGKFKESLADIVEELKNLYDIAGIGISTSGVVDIISGKLVFVNSNFTPELLGFNFKDYFIKSFSLPCFVDNDVNSMLKGELWLGGLQGYKNAVCITVGTGIGGALLFDGKLYYGSTGRAGEVGYIMPTKNMVDYWEKDASALALAKIVEVKFPDIKNLGDFFELYYLGNNDAKELFDKWLDSLSKGLATLATILDPEIILIGGGISEQGDKLLTIIAENTKKYINQGFRLPISFAKLGNSAGMVGAVCPFVNNI